MTELDALDAAGLITEAGRAMCALPLHPRLAHMVVDAAAHGAGETAAAIAAVLTERGLGGDDVDLSHRRIGSAATARAALRRPRHGEAVGFAYFSAPPFTGVGRRRSSSDDCARRRSPKRRT